MKFVRPAVIALSLTLGCLSLSAQAPAAPAAPAAKPAGKPVPTTSVAYINSSQFVAEDAGIKSLLRVIKELELEFANQQSELSLLNEKFRTAVTELNKLGAASTESEAFKAKQAEAVKMQQELQTKQQQFQAAVQQAQQAKQAPIAAELTKAIADYAKDRDIGVLLDVAKLGDAVIAAKPELDVTSDFVAHFNATHP